MHLGAQYKKNKNSLKPNMNKGVKFQELHGVCFADPRSCPCSVPASKSSHIFDFKNNGPHLWTHRVLSLSLTLTRVSIPKRGLGMRVFKRYESRTLPSLFFMSAKGARPLKTYETTCTCIKDE